MPTKPKTKNERKHGTPASPVSRQVAVPGTDATAVTNYEEIQKFEMEALQAIYMDDFKEIKMKPAAWNVSVEINDVQTSSANWPKRASNLGFSLRLKAPSNEEVQVVLTVELPATYPKTLPVLKISGLENLKS